MWTIEFFEKNNGHCPTQEFLDGLNKSKDIPFIENAMEQLREHGYKLDRPKVGYLRDDIYELRVKTINGKFRFLYFFFDKDKIIMTHGIKKKVDKVPPEEIERAIEYKNIYLSREKEKDK